MEEGVEVSLEHTELEVLVRYPRGSVSKSWTDGPGALKKGLDGEQMCDHLLRDGEELGSG